jgi:hypothetical protein
MSTPITDGRDYTFRWTYRRATGVATWSVSGNGYNEVFSQSIGDVPNIIGSGTNRAYVGMTAATGGCWEEHRLTRMAWAPVCDAPKAPANTVLVALSSDTWRLDCVSGYTGTSTTITASPSDCSSGGSPPSCAPCGAGYYCKSQFFFFLLALG